MSECQKCHESVPTHAKVCPECGAPANALANAATPKPDTEESVHSLLLNAHLQKIRGDLDSAISECIQALRINPDSMEAHTLLGDIYQDQGNIEEAVHWYKLALDLNPDSRNSREKLTHLAKQKHPAPQSEIVDESAADSKSPIFKFNIVVVQSVLISVLLLVLASVIFRPSPKTTKVEEQPPYHYSDVPLGAPASTELKSPGAQTEEQANADQAESPSQLSSTTDLDSYTIKELNARPSLANGNLQVTSATYDPRYDTETITFISPTVDGGLAGRMLIRQGLIVAKEEFSRNTSLPNITIRILYPVPINEGVRLETVFVGDVSRDKTSSIDLETASYTEQLAVFDNNSWWHQDIK